MNVSVLVMGIGAMMMRNFFPEEGTQQCCKKRCKKEPGLSTGSRVTKHNNCPGLRSFSELGTSVLNWESPGQVACPNQKDL